MKYTEGQISINVPGRDKLARKNLVFLNEEKKFDRDIHIILLKALKQTNKSYLDLFGASGIRGLRIAKETKYAGKIVFNDLKKTAYNNIKKNAAANKVKAFFFNNDARELLCSLDFGVDAIDIDPYGSPIYYIIDAVKALSRGGLLSITATDTGALSGTFPKTCRRRYHSTSYKSEFYYESGLRILAKECINLCSTFDVALIPIFAHATRHYFRIYFKKVKGAGEADKLIKNIDYISYCPKCLEREIGIKELCNCGNKRILIGPLFTGNLYDINLVRKMSKSDLCPDFFKKILEEAEVNIPWFYTTDMIAKKYKIREPRMKELNFARTHINPKGFKTKKSIKEFLRLIKK